VDIDRFLATNQPAWDRLAALCHKAGRGVGRLDAAELDELVRLYQRVSSQLSYARTYFADPALTARLTALVGRANAVVYGSRPRSLRAFRTFFTTTFPAAVWDARRFVAVSAALVLVPAVVIAVWLAHSPRAIEASGPAALREAYVNHDFASYYRAQPSAQFAAQVQTNNIRVAFMAFAGGVAGCVLTAYLLAQNGAGVGYAAGLFAHAGRQQEFWGLILPHGLLELSSVIVAGAAGLRLGWALISQVIAAGRTRSPMRAAGRWPSWAGSSSRSSWLAPSRASSRAPRSRPGHGWGSGSSSSWPSSATSSCSGGQPPPAG